MEHLETETPANTTAGDTPTKQEGETQANYEKRYKEAQAWGTKTSQENARLRAENEALKEVVPTAVTLNLSGEVQEELDTLLDTDPDAWRSRMNSLEAEARKELDSRIEQAQAAAMKKTELAHREQVLEAFVNSPDTVLTTASLDEIPVRIQNKLEKGEITFEEFLGEADAYLQTGKVIANPTTPQSPNLDNAGNGNPTLTEDGAVAAYGEAIF